MLVQNLPGFHRKTFMAKNDETAGRAFMAKNDRMRKLLLEKFFNKSF